MNRRELHWEKGSDCEAFPIVEVKNFAIASVGRLSELLASNNISVVQSPFSTHRARPTCLSFDL